MKEDGNWKMAFLGSIAPREWLDRYPLIKSPTIEIQDNLIREWSAGGVPLDRIFTTLPVPRFPRAKLTSLRHGEELIHGVRATFLGWWNWEPCKTAGIGFDLVRKVRRWAREVREKGGKPVLFAYNLGPSHWQGPACLLASRLAAAPLISLVTDLEPPAREDGIRRPFLAIALRIQMECLSRCAALAVLNQQVLHDLPRPVGKSMVVNGLVSDDGFTRRLLALPMVGKKNLDQPVLMYLGSLNVARGPDLLLEAFLEWDHPGARLVYVGSGPLEASLKRAAGSDDRIQFHGFVSDTNRLLALYAEADILVNPHRVDVAKARYVFPSKLAQYLASGRPVVSTDQGGAAAAFRNLAWFADRDSPDGLAAAFSAVLASDEAEFEPRLAKARQFVATRKLWEKQAPELAAFVEGSSGVR